MGRIEKQRLWGQVGKANGRNEEVKHPGSRRGTRRNDPHK